MWAHRWSVVSILVLRSCGFLCFAVELGCCVASHPHRDWGACNRELHHSGALHPAEDAVLTATPKPRFSRVLMLMTAPGLAVVIVVQDDRSRVPACRRTAEEQSQLWLEAVGLVGLEHSCPVLACATGQGAGRGQYGQPVLRGHQRRHQGVDLGISTLTPVVKDLGVMSWPVCFSSGHCRGLAYRRCVDLVFIRGCL